MMTASSLRLQPNTETRKKQLEAWRSLILSYCRHQRVYTLDLAECLQSPLFYNADIERKRPISYVSRDHWFYRGMCYEFGPIECAGGLGKSCIVVERKMLSSASVSTDVNVNVM